MSSEAVQRRVTFRDVLGDREFRALFVAQAMSVVGDQLARIAVAVLIFSRSHSPLLTAASFGVSYLPWVIGGPLLAGYADRLRRRNVMIFCDLTRAVLVTALAVHGLPTAALLLLVVAVALLEPPFSASRASMLPDVVGEGERYAIASTLSNTTNSLGVVLGFAMGGALVAGIGVRATILLDTVTFLVSAALLELYVKDRPPGAAERGPRTSGGRSVTANASRAAEAAKVSASSSTVLRAPTAATTKPPRAKPSTTPRLLVVLDSVEAMA